MPTHSLPSTFKCHSRVFARLCPMSAVSVLALIATSAPAQQVTYQNIGQQVPTPNSVVIGGITDDGKTIAGNARSGATTVGFTWNTTAGRVNQNDFGFMYNHVNGISGNGQVIFGNARAGAFFVPVFQAPGAMPTQLPLPLLGATAGDAYDATPDGKVIVGSARSGMITNAVRWEDSGAGYVALNLGDLPGGSDLSIARGISGDGTIVVGSGWDTDQIAFRWTQATGMVALGDLPGGRRNSSAFEISRDGSTIVGFATDATQQRAFRWTQSEGMVALQKVDPSETSATAYDVSANGAIIVGTATIAAGGGAEVATRWTKDTGTENLKTILQANGVNMANTNLESAKAITPDGKVITGQARVDFGAGDEATGFIALYDPAPVAATSASTPTTGVIFPRDFTDSANSISNGLRLGGHAARLTSDGLFFQGLNAPTASGGFGFAQRPTEFGGFVFGQGRQLLSSNPDSGQTGAGGAGVTLEFPNGIMAGLGVLALRHNYTAGLSSSTVKIDGQGGGFFLRYAPQRTGAQMMISGAILSLNADISRNYRNGGAIVAATGRTKGRFADIRARFGWGMALSGATTLTPFAQLSRSTTTFNGYTEAGGLFAGTVTKQSSSQNTAKLGAELRHKLNSKVEVHGSLGITRTSESGALASLSIGALGGATFGGGSANRSFNTAVAEIGVTYAVSDSLSLQTGLSIQKGLGGARDADEAALSAGLSFSF